MKDGGETLRAKKVKDVGETLWGKKVKDGDETLRGIGQEKKNIEQGYSELLNAIHNHALALYDQRYPLPHLIFIFYLF